MGGCLSSGEGGVSDVRVPARALYNRGTRQEGALRVEHRMSLGSRVWRSELTPLAFLERSADIFRERVAVIDGERRYSYAELGERVRQLASGLQRAGVER